MEAHTNGRAGLWQREREWHRIKRVRRLFHDRGRFSHAVGALLRRRWKRETRKAQEPARIFQRGRTGDPAVRSEVKGRHARSVFSGESQKSETRRFQSNAALWIWRLQNFDVAELLTNDWRGLVGTRRRVCAREYSRGWRVRTQVARCRAKGKSPAR